MCGIAGVLAAAGAPLDGDRRALASALGRLRHRGPDDEGIFAEPGVLLGHRRLSILDLSPAGHQPMASPDGRRVLILNGEIYNYLELRSELAAAGVAFHTGTDTEVLLAAFARWGRGCLARLRGMFAFALWDRSERTLFLARDRVGEKPLYWWREGRRLAFASEMGALLELLPARPPLAPDAVHQFLHWQYVVEPATLLQGVQRLPAGHWLQIGPGEWEATPQPYWRLEDAAPLRAEPVEALGAVLEEAVGLTLRSDAPVGVGLSGGLDSGVIAAIAARQRPGIAAFTVGYPGRRDFDERAQAGALARSLGIPWFSAELATGEFADSFAAQVAAQDEPIADVAAYGHFAVARLAAQHGVKVLLTGLGGDELFFGYPWVREALRLSRLKLALLEGAGGRHPAARLKRAVVSGPALQLVANRRLPLRWREAVHRVLDPGKLDLEHPDEWVFQQLDYHWAPAERFTRGLYAAGFAARLTPRAAYLPLGGLGAARGGPPGGGAAGARRGPSPRWEWCGCSSTPGW